jgi:hypothetical protein
LARPASQNGPAIRLGKARRACALRGHCARGRFGAARWRGLTGDLGVPRSAARARVVYGKGIGQGEVEQGSPRWHCGGEAEEGSLRRHCGGEVEEGFRAAALSGEGGALVVRAEGGR